MGSKVFRNAGLVVPVVGLAALVLLLFLRRAGPSAHGLAVVPLTFDGLGVANHYPVASPDGRFLLFQRCAEPVSTRTPDGKTVYHFKEDESNWDIYRMRVDGSEVTRLTDAPAVEDEPGWSPDGTTIVYRMLEKACFTLWLMDADGGNKRPLLADPNSHSKTPSFSPDGRQVIFYANRAARQSWNIFTMDLAGGAIQQLTTGAFEDKHPQFTPDGRGIIFHSDRNNLTVKTTGPHKLMAVFSLDLESKEIHPLTDEQEHRDNRHAFVSPDGRHIVYHSLRYGPDPQHPGQYKKFDGDICVMTRDGRKRVNVTHADPRAFKHPSWSADSKGIYAVFKDKGDDTTSSPEKGGAWNLCYIDASAALKQLD